MEQQQQQSNPQQSATGYTNVVIQSKPKSVAVAFLLTFFFGPLGLFYSSVIGGVVMLIISVFVLIFTLGIGFLFTWPICIIWGVVAAEKINKEHAMRM